MRHFSRTTGLLLVRERALGHARFLRQAGQGCILDVAGLALHTLGVH